MLQAKPATIPSPSLDHASDELCRILETSQETPLNTAKQAIPLLVAELQEQVRRLEQQLQAAEVVEKATARRCDKLEQQLQEAHREGLSLARALGTAEAQRDAARLLVQPPASKPDGWLRRLFRRSSR